MASTPFKRIHDGGVGQQIWGTKFYKMILGNQELTLNGNCYATMEPSIRFSTIFMRTQADYDSTIEKLTLALTKFDTSRRIISKPVEDYILFGFKFADCNRTTFPAFREDLQIELDTMFIKMPLIYFLMDTVYDCML